MAGNDFSSCELEFIFEKPNLILNSTQIYSWKNSKEVSNNLPKKNKIINVVGILVSTPSFNLKKQSISNFKTSESLLKYTVAISHLGY